MNHEQPTNQPKTIATLELLAYGFTIGTAFGMVLGSIFRWCYGGE